MKLIWIWIGILVGLIAIACLSKEVEGENNDNYISVTFPSGGETFYSDDSIEIRWDGTDSGDDDDVNIKLYLNGGEERTIVSNTNDEGSHNWYIPNDLKDSDNYQIKIRDEEDSSDYDFSYYFSIYDKKIVVNTPNGGEKWYKEHSYTITWESTGASKYVDVDLYKYAPHNPYDKLQKAYTIAEDTSNDGSYIWIISSSISVCDEYKIKISDNSDSSLNDYSDNYFSISEPKNRIVMTFPKGGEKCYTSGSIEIRWSGNDSGPDDEVNIKLYLNGGEERTISSNTNDDGQYKWDVPNNLKDSDNYQIKITDLEDSSDYNFCDNISIYKMKIVIDSPNGGEKLYKENKYTIKWNSTGASKYVNIDLIKSSSKVYTIAEGTLNDGNHTWTISSSISDNNYKIKITDSHLSSLNDYSDNDFSLSNPPKSIVIISPNGGEKWYKENKYTITWNSTGISNYVNIDLYHSSTKVNSIAKGTSNDGNHTWTIPSSLTQNYKYYYIRITDKSDSNIYDISDSTFSISKTSSDKTEGDIYTYLIVPLFVAILITLLIVLVGGRVSKSKEESKPKKLSQKRSKKKSTLTKPSQKTLSQTTSLIEISSPPPKKSTSQKPPPPHPQNESNEDSPVTKSSQKPLYLPPIPLQNQPPKKSTSKKPPPPDVKLNSDIESVPETVVKECQFCGAEILGHYKFCAKCGEKL